MDKFYAVTLVINALLVINIFLGIGNWFAYEMYKESYIDIEINPEIGITYNQTQLDNLSESLKLNYGAGAGEGIIETARTVLFAIPDTSSKIMEVANIPVSLKELILSALYGLLGFAYIIFGLEIWSYIRGYGGG